MCVIYLMQEGTKVYKDRGRFIIERLDKSKNSLVYDMMELFRQKIIDRFVLTLINKKVMSLEYFYLEDGNCRLTDEGKTRWIVAYEGYMNKPVKEYEENTPRQMIMDEVKDFVNFIKKVARMVEKEKDTVTENDG